MFLELWFLFKKKKSRTLRQIIEEHYFIGHGFHLPETRTNVFVLATERRGERHNKQRQQCVCMRVMRVKRREREGGRDQSRGLGLCFSNLCVGGEASPTQNALRHSSQPTQVSRCIFSLQASLFISHLQRFSESLETVAECSRMLRARCQPLICATSC